MAVSINATDPRHPGTWQSSETLTQSTATAFQALDPHIDVSFLGMGTATGDNSNNLYSLTSTGHSNGDAVEGMEKFIMSTGTGEAAVYIDLATGRLPVQMAFMSNSTATTLDACAVSATGNWVFGVDGDFMHLKFMNGNWLFLNGQGVTQATAT